MSDERELKLQCLTLAGGDVAKARAMFEWLSEDQGDREVRAYVSGTADGYMTATQALAAEKETAREQLEREPDHVPTMRADWEDEPNDFEDFEDDDTPTEHISDLTGDPAIEPESGLHGEAVELTAAKLFNEHWGRTEEGGNSIWPLSRQHPGIQEAWREKARELLAAPTPAVMEMANEIIEEAPALNADMQDEREEPVALAQPEWNEPVTSEAKMFSHGIQSEQKPDPRDWPFSHLFTGKPKVGA